MGRRAVYISTVASYEGCRSHYGRVKLETEKAALSRGYWVVRPGLIRGGTPGGIVGTMLLVKKLPIVPIIGYNVKCLYSVHADELSCIVAQLIAQPPKDTEELARRRGSSRGTQPRRRRPRNDPKLSAQAAVADPGAMASRLVRAPDDRTLRAVCRATKRQRDQPDESRSPPSIPRPLGLDQGPRVTWNRSGCRSRSNQPDEFSDGPMLDRPGDHEYDGTVSDRFGSHRPPAVASMTPRSAQSSITSTRAPFQGPLVETARFSTIPLMDAGPRRPAALRQQHAQPLL